MYAQQEPHTWIWKRVAWKSCLARGSQGSWAFTSRRAQCTSPDGPGLHVLCVVPDKQEAEVLDWGFKMLHVLETISGSMRAYMSSTVLLWGFSPCFPPSFWNFNITQRNFRCYSVCIAPWSRSRSEAALPYVLLLGPKSGWLQPARCSQWRTGLQPARASILSCT